MSRAVDRREVCVYLVDSTHACDGSYVVRDGDQCRPGQVLLTDAVSLLFAHHVTKTVKEQPACMRRHVKGCKHELTGRFHNHTKKSGNLLKKKNAFIVLFYRSNLWTDSCSYMLIGETVINNVMIFLFRLLCHMFNWNVNKWSLNAYVKISIYIMHLIICMKLLLIYLCL